MSLRRVEIDSSKKATQWLSSVTEAMKALQLKVKTEDDVAYVALGNDSQIAIYPQSETAGKFEKQVKENDTVKVVDASNYDSIDKLIDAVKQIQSTNSSKQQVSTTRRILRAGKNHQKALMAEKLNASRFSQKKTRTSRIPLATDPGSNKRGQVIRKEKGQRGVFLNSSRGRSSVNETARKPQSDGKKLVNLKADSHIYQVSPSVDGSNLVSEISKYTDSFQKVEGVLFNKPDPITGSPELYIAYVDSDEGVIVVSKIVVDSDGGVFKTVTELAESCFYPPVDYSSDPNIQLDESPNLEGGAF